MADDFSKNLGKAQVQNNIHDAQEKERKRANDKFSHWNEALEAYANGWRRPKSEFPIIISTHSPISTPEKLQEIAKMETAPKVLEATYTTLDGGPDENHLDADGNPEKVGVGMVD